MKLSTSSIRKIASFTNLCPLLCHSALIHNQFKLLEAEFFFPRTTVAQPEIRVVDWSWFQGVGSDMSHYIRSLMFYQWGTELVSSVLREIFVLCSFNMHRLLSTGKGNLKRKRPPEPCSNLAYQRTLTWWYDPSHFHSNTTLKREAL